MSEQLDLFSLPEEAATGRWALDFELRGVMCCSLCGIRFCGPHYRCGGVDHCQKCHPPNHDHEAEGDSERVDLGEFRRRGFLPSGRPVCAGPYGVKG